MSSLDFANQRFDCDFTWTCKVLRTHICILQATTSWSFTLSKRNPLTNTSLRMQKAYTVAVPFCDWLSYSSKSLIFMLMRGRWSRTGTCQPQLRMHSITKSPATRIQDRNTDTSQVLNPTRFPYPTHKYTILSTHNYHSYTSVPDL